jgi:hypothetical protein
LTIKPEQRTLENDLRDLFRRVKKLEAVPGGGGGAGIDCNDYEPEGNRALPWDQTNFLGYPSYPWSGANKINDYSVDTGCINNGYISSSSPVQFDNTFWTVWLGPVGARFRLELLVLLTAASGRLHLYAERMVESATPGVWEPEDTSNPPIDIFATFAGHFADLYAGSTQRNIWVVSYDFGVGGAGCDTPFTAVDDSVPWGYELNGSPSFYRLWLVVEGKHASSSGYDARLQEAWLKRLTEDAQ